MSPCWSSRSACSAPIRRRSWPSARRVRIGDLEQAGQAAARAAAARDGADDAGRVRVLAVGGAILLLDALFLGLLFGGGSAGAAAGRIPPVNRSISAVLLGTFTLRFSTGLTGGLLVYYLDALPEYGGWSPAPPSAS